MNFTMFVGFIFIVSGIGIFMSGLQSALDKKYEIPKGKVIVVFDSKTFEGKVCGFYPGLTSGHDERPIELWGMESKEAEK